MLQNTFPRKWSFVGKAFIAKRDFQQNMQNSLGFVYFIFALDKHGRMVDGVCRIAKGNGRRYIFWK